MRIKHELGSVEAPRNLLLSKKATQEVLQRIPAEKCGRTISPETQSHRLQKGWQHLQDSPENILNNNSSCSNSSSKEGSGNSNNNSDNSSSSSSSSENLNSRSSKLDDVVAPEPPSPDIHAEDGYQSNNDDTESDDSSSDDEDTSISFSDTSPLLDVSSLDEDSSSSDSESSNESSDAEMSDDGDCPAECDNLDNNNSDDSTNKDTSMDSSWMSFSSSASSSDAAARKSSATMSTQREGLNKRNGVVLPDVLPVAVPKQDEDALRERRELELQMKRRELKLDATPRISRDCCIVEITTQPDIHVDIRLNPGIDRSFPEPYMKQRSSYPSDATKNYNFYFKARDVDSQCSKTVQNAISSARDKPAPRYFSMGEGVRLNNFTIVNGFNALSLTEVVKSKDLVKENGQSQNNMLDGNQSAMEMLESPSNHGGRRKSSENKEPVNDSPRVKQRAYQSSPCQVLEPKPHTDGDTLNSLSLRADENRDNADERNRERECFYQEQKRATSCTARDSSTQTERFHMPHKTRYVRKLSEHGENSPKPSTVKSTEGKLSSPELFEVYTMESAASHVNWTTARCNREAEWIKKRQNDREEIRRKLAMGSDNEDHVTEKRNTSQDMGSVDRLKGGTNLQICFLNEAAKESDAKTEGAKEAVPQKPPLPRILKKNALFPPSLRRNSMSSPKVLNNNNGSSSSVADPQVTKRQRPTFFFNRPRSWHAAKTEEKHYSTEDLFTCHQRLQEEAREALAQAKEMARMQMEIERQKKKKSPIADIVGISFPDGHNLLSRHALQLMNVAQLQVIVNDLHSQIETLNEDLVKFLLERDDLHMEQDSMLVDIEDLTRYLGLKGNTSITQSCGPKFSGNAPSNCSNQKPLKAEPVRRSQSVHLKKSKNFLWPWHRHSVFSCTYSQG